MEITETMICVHIKFIGVIRDNIVNIATCKSLLNTVMANDNSAIDLLFKFHNALIESAYPDITGRIFCESHTPGSCQILRRHPIQLQFVINLPDFPSQDAFGNRGGPKFISHNNELEKERIPHHS